MIMSARVGSGLQFNNYFTLATLVRNGSFILDLINYTRYAANISDEEEDPVDDIANIPAVRGFFYCVYAIIFLLGIFGNVLVCYVVLRNKTMQTVTNIFITNLALSDILLCTFAVPFTPIYMFMQQWIFGRILCHLVPYAQGVSVYISAFTLMSIAIDRFFVIIYPFKTRLKMSACYAIVIAIWFASASLTIPYGVFMNLILSDNGIYYCDEVWPQESDRKAFGFSTSVLQFVVPFVIITFCYVRVCGKLNKRAKAKPGSKSLKKEEVERARTRRTNRMLIAMVVIFGASWLPLNVYNLVVDFHIPAAKWKYLSAFYFFSHAAAMSSTCYNPFLYAWLNENFRKEFKTVLPCFDKRLCSRRIHSAKRQKTCNGNETALENLLPKTGQMDTDKFPNEDSVTIKFFPKQVNLQTSPVVKETNMN